MHYELVKKLSLVGLVFLAGCHKAAAPSMPAKAEGVLLRLNPALNQPYTYSVSESVGMSRPAFSCKVKFTFLSKKTLRNGKSAQYEANVAITDVKGTDPIVKRFPKGGLKFKQAVYDTGGLNLTGVDAKSLALKRWANAAMPELPWKPVSANSKLVLPIPGKAKKVSTAANREWDISALGQGEATFNYSVKSSNAKGVVASEEVDLKDGMLAKKTSTGARDIFVERL